MKKALLVALNSEQLPDFYEIRSFPTACKTETLTLNDFLKIKSFPNNREVEIRAKKAVKRLVDVQYKHNEVSIIQYLGPDVDKPGVFRKGERYVVDGNTRKYIWKKYIDDTPITTEYKQFPIPKDIQANIYTVDSAEEAVKFYYTIDSIDAAETQPEKITGVFRGLNLLNTLQNPKIKAGKINTALNIAAPTGRRQALKTPFVNDFTGQIDALRELIVATDKLFPKGFSGALVGLPSLGVAWLAGKHMMSEEAEQTGLWEEVMTQIGEVNFRKPLPTANWIHTAVEYMVKGAVENPVLDAPEGSLPYKTGASVYPYIVQNYLSYCWLKIINNDPWPTGDLTIDMIDNSYNNLWRIAWDVH